MLKHYHKNVTICSTKRMSSMMLSTYMYVTVYVVRRSTMYLARRYFRAPKHTDHDERRHEKQDRSWSKATMQLRSLRNISFLFGRTKTPKMFLKYTNRRSYVRAHTCACCSRTPSVLHVPAAPSLMKSRPRLYCLSLYWTENIAIGAQR